MAWTIIPYIGLGEIKFDLNILDIISIIGSPSKDKQTMSGRRRLQFGEKNPAIVFEGDNLVEIAALPDIEGGIFYKKLNIFSDNPSEVLKILQNENGQIYERNGFLVFFKLGFVLTGIHDGDKGQRSLVMFKKDFYWANLKKEMNSIVFKY